MSPTVQVCAAIRCISVDACHSENGDASAGQIGGVSSFRVVRCLCTWYHTLEGDLPVLAGDSRRCDVLPTCCRLETRAFKDHGGTYCKSRVRGQKHVCTVEAEQRVRSRGHLNMLIAGDGLPATVK
jgi:hypothetical protein